MRTAIVLLTANVLAAAHTTFTNFFINGQPQGDGVCVRMGLTPQNATFPLPQITVPDMACGIDGSIGLARVCPAPAGSVITFEFREWPDASHPGSIDPSHKGPIAVYMKRVTDPTANGIATGGGWFKIYGATFDNSTGKWATETLIANNGHLSVTLPSDLAQGYYLVRTEVLALHRASDTPPDPQFYVGCAQIFLRGSGKTVPMDEVAIPGYVNMAANHAAMTFDIYKQPMALPYPEFGPPLYSKTSVEQDTGTMQIEQLIGLKPNDCVLENANWCGIELATYYDEVGCWNASQNCWAQCKLCYSQAPPTGSKNCKIWEGKCSNIEAACNANDVIGPPDQGKDLNPPLSLSSVSLPPPANGPVLCAYCTDGDRVAVPIPSGLSSTSLHSVPSSSQGTTSVASVRNNEGDTTTITTVTSTEWATSTVKSGFTSPRSIGGIGAATSFASMTLDSQSPGTVAAWSTFILGPSPAGGATTSTSASLSGSYASLAAAFGSFDECGPRNASASCAQGLCCSKHGFCGAVDDYCGEGCLAAFGRCDSDGSSTLNGTCSDGEFGTVFDGVGSSGACSPNGPSEDWA